MKFGFVYALLVGFALKAVTMVASVAALVVLFSSAGLIGLSVAALYGTEASHPPCAATAWLSQVVVRLSAKRALV